MKYMKLSSLETFRYYLRVANILVTRKSNDVIQSPLHSDRIMISVFTRNSYALKASYCM